MFSLFKTNPIPEDGQMDLMEHLAELRSRIFRSLLYIIIGMVLTYSLYPWFYGLLASPVQEFFGSKAQLVFSNIPDAFMLRMQVCLITGLMAAFPLVILEIWGFIGPALTETERKPILFLAPFSVLLSLAGLGIGYVCLPVTYQWMLTFVDDVPGATLMQNAKDYILLTVKILLGFSVSFQLPLLLLFLARVGLITADIMTKYWRHAVVGIAAFAAILTPSPDPVSMLMMGIPMAGLYAVSIFLVRAFQPREDGTRSLSFGTMLIVALAPITILGAVGYWLTRTPSASATGKPIPIASPSPSPSPAATANEDIEAIKQILQSVQQQNAELLKRIEALEAKEQGAMATPQPVEDKPLEQEPVGNKQP
jgi:sec-independent protein translocase protein TatC